MAGRQTAVQHDQRDAVYTQQPLHEPHLEAANLLPQRATVQAAQHHCTQRVRQDRVQWQHLHVQAVRLSMLEARIQW